MGLIEFLILIVFSTAMGVYDGPVCWLFIVCNGRDIRSVTCMILASSKRGVVYWGHQLNVFLFFNLKSYISLFFSVAGNL